MKLKSGFVLHSIGDEHIVVPVEERTRDFHGMIRLNKTGAFLWERMSEEFTKESLTRAILEHYEVTEDVAMPTVEKFIKTLVDGGIIEE